jgi:hypothetical protein
LAGFFLFGISPCGFLISSAHGARSRCLPLCAYSVGSPIPTPHRMNQNAMAGRISGQSPIRSGQWGGMVRQARTNYQCGRVDGTAGRWRAGQDSGQDRAGQRSGAGQPATSNNQLSTHRPPPHGCWPQPFISANASTRKIPCVENFLLKSKPSTDLFNPRLPLIGNRPIKSCARFL